MNYICTKIKWIIFLCKSVSFAELFFATCFPFKHPQSMVIMFCDIHFVGFGLKVKVADPLKWANNMLHWITSLWWEDLYLTRSPVSNKEISFVIKIHAISTTLQITWNTVTKLKSWIFFMILRKVGLESI